MQMKKTYCCATRTLLRELVMLAHLGNACRYQCSIRCTPMWSQSLKVKLQTLKTKQVPVLGGWTVTDDRIIVKWQNHHFTMVCNKHLPSLHLPVVDTAHCIIADVSCVKSTVLCFTCSMQQSRGYEAIDCIIPLKQDKVPLFKQAHAGCYSQ